MFSESGRVFGEDTLEGKSLGRLRAEMAWEDRVQEGALSSRTPLSPGLERHHPGLRVGSGLPPGIPGAGRGVRSSLEGLFKLGSWPQPRCLRLQRDITTYKEGPRMVLKGQFSSTPAFWKWSPPVSRQNWIHTFPPRPSLVQLHLWAVRI